MKVIDILWYIWQLPQNLCGLFYKNISKNNRISVIENNDSRSVGAKVFLQKSNGGVTLGKYIFIYQDYMDKAHVIKHECGHVKQSKILGPLYLIIIGIPSLLHAWFIHDYICENPDYEHWFTEKWANKLMGIE